PNEFLAGGEFFGGAPNALLQLTDIDLPSLQIDAARLEHTPAFARELAAEQPQERGFAGAALTADQQRALRQLRERAFRRLHRFPPRACVDQELAFLARHPKAAERAQELAVDARVLEADQILDQRSGKGMIEPLEKGLDLCRRRGAMFVERRTEFRLVA